MLIHKSNLLTIWSALLITMICAISANGVPDESWFPKAPPYVDRHSVIQQVSSVDELLNAIENAKEGETILLEDRIYYMPRYVEIHKDRVTLRSASGDRNKVILDASKSIHGEILGFANCTGVTVADLTIQNVRWNGFKINSDKYVQKLTIYNCVIHNIWQRGVKSVRVPLENREQIRPKNCKIQYCLFYNDHPKRYSDDDKDTEYNFKGNYIGGIDTMYAKGWLISDNVFIGINGRTREGRGCVFMWHHAEDCVIERNIIIDCDVGIALGNSSGIGEGQSSVHATNMIVRNNFVTRTPETGILADHTKDCKIVNNTVYDPENKMNRLLRIVHDNPGLQVMNNLLSGPGISVMNEGEDVYKKNLIGDFDELFVNPEKGNLHLVRSDPRITDQGEALLFVENDIDRVARDKKIDIGADEWRKQSQVLRSESENNSQTMNEPATSFQVPAMWEYSAPLIAPELRETNPSHAQKDPSVVFFDGKWHVFMTVKLQGKSAIEYCSFKDWKDANQSKRTILEISKSDYYCAPQVFYFRPHKKWYLVYQMGVPGANKMWVAYSTTSDISDPDSWTQAKPMLDGGENDPRKVGGLDYWIICDDKSAYLFLTSLNGKMWRLWTRLEDFPQGFRDCEIALEAKIFEASHTYALKGMNKYLTIIEENGKRYYKAYLADRLDGKWTPIADTAERPFAGWNNVRPANGVKPWTDNISHGELVRESWDETLTIDPMNLRFVFQGMWDKDKSDKGYGQFQWRIGMLTPITEKRY